MAKITLYIKPNKEVLMVDSSYEEVLQMVEAPTRYLRCRTEGKRVTVQKSFIFKIEEDEGDMNEGLY